MNKKLVSVALTASTVIWGLGLATLPLAHAQTTADLQAQIAALLAQISALQTQLNSSSSGASASQTFANNLTVGSKGADVNALQQLLINKGFLAAAAPTGYFGSLTKAALAKYQAANGISPAAGYFGPKTRAFVNSMAVGTGTGTGTATGTGTGTGTGTSTTTTTTVTAPATGLAVSLAADNPVTGSLISGTTGAARVPVLAVNLTAGSSGAVSVSEIKFHKTGVLSDSSVSGAYLTVSGKVIAQYNSINQGVVDFAGLSVQIPAGQTQKVVFAIDVAGGLSAGNTTGFSLQSANDINSFDANNNLITESGPFPLNGNTFTVTTVTNPSLATLTIASSSIGTQVTAGTQGNLVGAWNFTGGNSKLWLKGLNFRVIGSASKGDLRNVKLMVNGTQVGATLASVAQDGTAYFDASANPGVLNTGSNNVQLFADVMGSPSYNFQFEILNGYDVLAVDSQYNVPVTASSNVGTQVAIQQGQITVTQDSGTPTGNIAKGQSQITLAKFDIYAAGEAVRVKFLAFKLTFGAATTTLSSEVKNISLVDDAGGQVGSTINTPPSGNTCDNNGSSITAGTSALPWNGSATGTTVVDCFGTSASPVNYVIPANTTRVLSLKADIQSTADFATLVASLAGNVSNLQGLTSSATGSTGIATGSSLSLAASSLTVAQNNALGNQSLAKGTTGQRIGSYALSASSAEGVNVSNVSIQAGGVAYLQNLKAMVKGAQFGTTQGVVSSGTVYTFSGTPFNIPAGTTVNVDVFSDILSSASGSATPASSLSGCSATGAVSFAAISCSTQAGQNLTLAGQSGITVTADSTQAPVGQIVMGSTGNSLATFRFTETTNVENVKVTDLNVLDSVLATSTVKPAFSNLTLWNGSTQVGTGGTAVATASSTQATIVVGGTVNATGTYSVVVNGVTETSAAGGPASTTAQVASLIASSSYPTGVTAAAGSGAASSTVTITAIPGLNLTVTATTTTQNGATLTITNATPSGWLYAFHFGTPIVVPQANSVSLTLKGDAASYASSGSSDNTAHTFKIATTTDSTNASSTQTVVALGNTSNASSSVTISSANGNALTVQRSKLTFAATPLGATSGRGKIPSDQLATLSFTANSAGPIALDTVVVTFSGTAPSISTFLDGVSLRDENNASLTTVSTSSAACNGLSVSTTATGTITVAATGTTVGTYAVVINGFTVTSVSEPTSTSATQIATDITTAITASSSVVGVTATSTTNVVRLTATTAGTAGNMTLSTGTIPSGASLTFATTNGANSATTCTVTWFLATTTAGQIVSAGATRTWTLVVDSTKTQAVTGTSNVNLVATINAVSSIQYTDALDSAATSTLTMPTSVLTPINLNSVVYQQGT